MEGLSGSNRAIECQYPDPRVLDPRSGPWRVRPGRVGSQGPDPALHITN